MGCYSDRFSLIYELCFLSRSLQYTFSTAKHTPRCVYYLFFETEHRKILLTWAHLGMGPFNMDMPEYDPVVCFLCLKRVQPWNWPPCSPCLLRVTKLSPLLCVFVVLICIGLQLCLNFIMEKATDTLRIQSGNPSVAVMPGSWPKPS